MTQPPSKKRPDWWDLPVPKLFPQTYLDIARERGADPTAILFEADLAEDAFAPPRSDITLLQMKVFLETVLSKVGNDGIGIDMGWRMPPTAFGNFGYALLCSETMGEVIKLCQRFWHLVGRGISLSVQEHGDTCVIDIATLAELPLSLRNIMYETTITSFYRGFQLLLATDVHDVEIWFDFPAPAHADKARSVLNNVRYDMPAIQFRFPVELLQHRLGMHNPTGLQFAIEQCEREESLLNIGLDQLVVKVQHEMVFGLQGYPSLETLSERLHLTARTLRRKLEQQGTNYKALLEAAKRRDAIRLLDDREMDIQRVAELLGYNDPANFTRAFRQWTGQTPSQYRLTRKSS